MLFEQAVLWKGETVCAEINGRIADFVCVRNCVQGTLVRLVIDFPICADHSWVAELDAASQPPVSTGQWCIAAEAPLL